MRSDKREVNLHSQSHALMRSFGIPFVLDLGIPLWLGPLPVCKTGEGSP